MPDLAKLRSPRHRELLTLASILTIVSGFTTSTFFWPAKAVTFAQTSVITSPAALVAGVDFPLLGLHEQKQPVFLSVRVYSWSQTPDDAMVLTPTDQVTTFPQLLRVDADSVHSVRIQSTRPLDGSREHYFRLVIEEFDRPPGERPATEDATVQFRNKPKVTIPVVISPTGVERPDPLVVTAFEQSQSLERNGRLLLRNNGTGFVVVSSMRALGTASTGRPTDLVTKTGLTVLAGSTVSIDVPTAFLSGGAIELRYGSAKANYTVRHRFR